MPAYDQTLFDPPAPVAIVSIRNPSSGLIATDILMLLDSGAEVTLLPEYLVQRLGLTSDDGDLYEMLGFNDSVSFSRSVRVDLMMLGKTFSGQFLLTPNSWGILGRNILNHLPILLDGPNRDWREFRR